LLTTAGLMIRSLMNAVSVDPGFNPYHLLALDLSLPPTKYVTPEEKSIFFTQAVQRLRDVPGARAAGAALCPPLVGVYQDSAYMLAEHPVRSVVDLPTAASNIVVPGYFETIQAPLLSGRFFNNFDTASSRLVAIVNQSFAYRYWPGEDAIGKLLREGGPKGNQPYREIVGVVNDLKQDGMDVEARPEVFLPVTQFPFASWTSFQAMTFVVRTDGDPTSVAETAKNQLQSMDKDLAVTAIRPMTQYMSQALERRGFTTVLLAAFAALALLLASVGAYGVMAYNVSQMAQEIGVRLALGATTGIVRKLVLGEALVLTSLGIVIGCAGALLATHWVNSLLFNTQAVDPAIFGSVSVVLLAVGILGSYLPMRRAMTIDPATALRS
jgi:putative ABC transport system permease protein